jgi:tungstate transport system substrate-binding protein
MTHVTASVVVIAAVVLLAGFVTGTPAFLMDRGGHPTLRIATTTSLDDSGLLGELLPGFQERNNVQVELIAVGTGQAIVLGERGDVDLILVHAPEMEQEFVDHGYGVERTTFMNNPFIVIGPSEDPATVSDANSAEDALARIAESEAAFVSRGDDSGTHMKEREIWGAAGFTPDSSTDWYHPVGQGMGETLLTANEMGAYTLTDRATFVAMDPAQVSDLESLYGTPGQSGEGDPLLDNPYTMIAVNPDHHQGANIDLAQTFIEWMNSDSTRATIGEYGLDKYGETLFTLIEDS